MSSGTDALARDDVEGVIPHRFAMREARRVQKFVNQCEQISQAHIPLQALQDRSGSVARRNPSFHVKSSKLVHSSTGNFDDHGKGFAEADNVDCG